MTEQGSPSKQRSRRSDWSWTISRFQGFILLSITTFTIGSLWLNSGLPRRYNQAPDFLQLPSRLLNDEVANKTGSKRLAYDEFMKKPPSEAMIAEYFHFDTKSLERETGRLHRLWTCSTDPRKGRETKLIYIQISRVAGATIRTFFRAYAEFCHAGLAVVTRCLDLGLCFMQGRERWANGSGPRSGATCLLSYALNHSGHEIDNGTISTAFLEENTDVLAGQVSLGSDRNWMNKHGEHVGVQYVVFFRDPLERYVSETLFATREQNMTVTEIVSLINSTAVTELARGRYYAKYTAYLISPEQKAWVETEGVEWTPARRVNLTLSNLINNRLLVGLTERMSQSFELLEYVLDAGHERPSWFRYFGSKRMMSAKDAVNMTALVLQEIYQDDRTMRVLGEFLKYEYQIYQFALGLHQRQYRWLQETIPKLRLTKRQYRGRAFL